MIRSDGLLAPTEPAMLRWSAAGEPESTRFNDYYYSSSGGDLETQHVFLAGNALAQRFSQAPTTGFSVGELGFGSGLNLLMTLDLFERVAPPNARLHYWTVDRYPLRLDALRRATERWPALERHAQAILAAYPPPVTGVHRRVLCRERVTIDFVWADAKDALDELGASGLPCIDAWYLDGFNPARNPAMWSKTLFPALARCSRPGATIATYTAASDVRRNLQDTGFTVTKRSGFGKKREYLTATLETSCDHDAVVTTRWETPQPDTSPISSAIVIGGGLAGAHAASALARRGLQVTVLEARQPASAASGNSQGVLFNRLSHQRSPLGDFSLLAFGFARAHYAQLFRDGVLTEGEHGDLRGCLQIDAPRGNASALAAALIALPEIAATVTRDETEGLLGTRCSEGGVWQANAGWLQPPAVCRALLAQPGITLHSECGEVMLEQTHDGKWRAVNSTGEVARADVAIIASGIAARNASQSAALPLRAVRGQTTQVPRLSVPKLRASLCHRGYIAPAADGEHCIGASFKPGDEDTSLRVEEHQSNIAALAGALPDWAAQLNALATASLCGRAALRCVSPDYLPMAGPVPIQDAFLRHYAKLGEDAKAQIREPGPYYKGLYVSVAHGSRGLSYAALCGELIASTICQDPFPLSHQLQRAVAPARFMIRDIVRGKATLA